MSPLPCLLERVYSKYAKIIAVHTLWFLIVPPLLTVVLAVGWKNFTISDNIFTTFSPASSEWKMVAHIPAGRDGDAGRLEDRNAFEGFFRLNESSIKFVLISCRHSQPPWDNILNPNMSERVAAVVDTLEGRGGGQWPGLRVRNLTYAQFAAHSSPYAGPNAFGRRLLSAHHSARPVPLTFPVTDARIYGKLFVPYVFGGSQYDNHTRQIHKITAMFLRLVVPIPTPEMLEIAEEFEDEIELFEASLKARNDPINLQVFSYSRLTDEVRLNSVYAWTWVPPSLVFVFIFTVLACSNRDLEESCHIHAIAGLLSTVMSFFAGTGLVFWFGVRYNDLVSMCAFLALAIGVDDSFVIISSWRRHRKTTSCLTERLCLVMGEAGASITLTSITDIVAFGIGIINIIPALHDFCIFTAVAIAFDFLFQVTFFPAAILIAERHRSWGNGLLLRLTPRCLRWVFQPHSTTPRQRLKDILAKSIVVPDSNGLSPVFSKSQSKTKLAAFFSVRSSNSGSGPSSVSSASSKGHVQPRWWKPVTTFCHVLTISSAVATLAASLYGLSRIQGNGAVSKLVTDWSVDDIQAYDIYEKSYWNQALLFQFIVDAPEMKNRKDMEDFDEFVTALENFAPYAMGRESTDIWTRDFLDHLDFFAPEEEEEEDAGTSHPSLAYDYSEYDYSDNDTHQYSDYYEPREKRAVELSFRQILSKYLGDVRGSGLVRVGEERVGEATLLYPTAFHFTTGFWGLPDWHTRVRFLRDFSTFKANWSRYHFAAYNDIIVNIDVLVYTQEAMIQTMGIVLCTTFFIAILFLPWERPATVFWVSTSFMAINCLVFGFLALWDVDIDVILMITMLMSVGFSVDYIVHMAYHYARQVGLPCTVEWERERAWREKRGSVAEFRVRETLSAIALPIVLSGISTLIAVALCGNVHSYMIRTFLKTIFLVVIFGLLHSLVLLPTLFYLTDTCKWEDEKGLQRAMRSHTVASHPRRCALQFRAQGISRSFSAFARYQFPTSPSASPITPFPTAPSASAIAPN